MSIAARAARVAQGDMNGCLWITRFHPQVQISDATATVARDDKPRVPGSDRGRNGRPEARRALGRKTCIEIPYDGECVSLGFLGAPHPLDVVAYLEVAGLAGSFRHLLRSATSACVHGDLPI